MSVGLHEGLRSAGCACRTVAEPPAAQPVWQLCMRARIVAYQPLQDIKAGRAVGVALGGVMVAARPDTVGRYVVLRPRALDRIWRRSWRVCTLTRWIACARRAGTPPFQSATRMLPRVLRLASRWRVPRECCGRTCGWVGGRHPVPGRDRTPGVDGRL